MSAVHGELLGQRQVIFLSRSREVDDQNNLIDLPGLLLKIKQAISISYAAKSQTLAISAKFRYTFTWEHFLMNRITKIFILGISALFALGAFAAIFDTMDSVDTLKKVAAKTQVTDRLPAGKVTDLKNNEAGKQADTETPQALKSE